MDWKKQFEKEIQMAQAARARGNEGQARVCARRAAGVAVREYFQRSGLPLRNSSAYDVLQQVINLSGLTDRTRQAAEALITRVTENFNLPIEADLLLEARILAENLLPGSGFLD
jgi:hypothetical protein